MRNLTASEAELLDASLPVMAEHELASPREIVLLEHLAELGLMVVSIEGHGNDQRRVWTTSVRGMRALDIYRRVVAFDRPVSA